MHKLLLQSFLQKKQRLEKHPKDTSASKTTGPELTLTQMLGDGKSADKSDVNLYLGVYFVLG